MKQAYQTYPTTNWPTADEVVQPIVAGLRRLNDLDGVGADLAARLDAGHVDLETIALARAFAHLVGDIARRCRAVAAACAPTHGPVAGTSIDTVVRLIADDNSVVMALAELQHPLG